MKLPWPILVVALALPTAGALVYFVAADPDDPLFRIAYATSKVIQFGLPVVVVLAIDRARLLAVRLTIRGLPAGVAVGVATAIVVLGVYALVFRGGPLIAGLTGAVRAKATGFGLEAPDRFFAFAALLSLVHAFLEEYYWRWFVHAGLRERLPPKAAIALSSGAFAAHHVVVLHVYFPGRLWTATIPFAAAVAVGGAVWAWLYDRYQSLAGPWAAHLLADAAVMAIGYDLLYG